MDINNINSSNDYDTVYCEPNFLFMLDTHLDYLRKTGNVIRVHILDRQNYKYIGDLFGLLNEININKEFHYIVMRLNNYLSSSDFNGDISELLIPDFNEVNVLKNIYQTKN